MSKAGRITKIHPVAAIPGGEVAIECSDFGADNFSECGAWFGETRARLVAASPRRLLAIVPDAGPGGQVDVRIGCNGGAQSEAASLTAGEKLVEDIHMVASPAVDPDDGAVYVTRSGSRGQRAPVSLFRVDGAGVLHDVTGEIANPTGLAFDQEGQLFVSSRMDGGVYRLTHLQEPTPFARNLGVATGIAFDREGRLYVGDRTGTIYRVNGVGEAREWASLESSVAAYHLAFGPDDSLYVSGPTVSSFDTILRFDQYGRRTPFFKGLGRPGGIAFDTEGYLYVAASYRGRRGIVRITPDGREAELFVAGMNVIGLAFNAAGDMIVATNEAVFSLPLGIRGTLV